MSYEMHKLRVQGNDINCLDLNEKHCLIWLLQEKLRDIRKRIDYFQHVSPLVQPDSFLLPRQDILPPPPSLQPSLHVPPSFDERARGRIGELRANYIDSMVWDQWFQMVIMLLDDWFKCSSSSSTTTTISFWGL